MSLLVLGVAAGIVVPIALAAGLACSYTESHASPVALLGALISAGCAWTLGIHEQRSSGRSMSAAGVAGSAVATVAGILFLQVVIFLIYFGRCFTVPF